MFFFFCFKQKTAYEMRISDWSSTCALPIYEILTSTIQNRETAAGKANVLAASVIIDGDPRAADKQLAAIAQVTAADIQRVARTYLADEHSAAIRYLPAESAAAGATSATVSVPATVVTAPLTAPADIKIDRKSTRLNSSH